MDSPTAPSRPGTPSKIATTKKNDAGAGSGKGVWGTVARGAATAWRTVRGRGQQHELNAAATVNGKGEGDDTAPSTPHSASNSQRSSLQSAQGEGGPALGGGGDATDEDQQDGRHSKNSPSTTTTRSTRDVSKNKQKGQTGKPKDRRSKKNVYGAAYGANSGTIASRRKGEGTGGGGPWGVSQRGVGGGFPGGAMRGSVSAGERERRELEVREGLGRAELELGSAHPRVAAHLFLLSRMAQERGGYAEAEQLCERALEIYEETLGPDHPDVGVALNCLALSWQAQVWKNTGGRGWKEERWGGEGGNRGLFFFLLCCLIVVGLGLAVCETAHGSERGSVIKVR